MSDPDRVAPCQLSLAAGLRCNGTSRIVSPRPALGIQGLDGFQGVLRQAASGDTLWMPVFALRDSMQVSLTQHVV